MSNCVLCQQKRISFLLIIAFLFFSSSCYTVRNKSDETVIKNNESHSSWPLLPFTKVDTVNPVLKPGDRVFNDPVTKQQVAWEAKDVFNPAVVVKDNKICMLYRAEDSVGKYAGTSRIGLAVSEDGFHFKRYPKPVLYPENDAFKKYEWPGGCEDPRVVQDSVGTYYMAYTAYDGKTARLFIATSKDLVHWKKYGSVFAKAYHGKYANKWSKSGSIVSKYENPSASSVCRSACPHEVIRRRGSAGRLRIKTPVAVKINGKYWMYWGDKFIWAATSDDLINWKPVEMQAGEKPPVPLRGYALTMPDLKIIVSTRKGRFDNDLVEPGPPAMLTDRGILLIYNGRNTPEKGDPALPEGTYCGGQVLLDKNDPTRILHRLNKYFIKPDKPYEITGQVNNVCFLEGLVHFRQKWFLYYGTADSKIAVAVNSLPPKP